MCACETGPGMSSFSTEAALACGMPLSSVAIMSNAPETFPNALARMTSVEIDRHYVHERGNEQHEEQRDMQHVP